MALAPAVWTEQREIESFDVDPLGRLRPQALFAYLLNSAWNHARGTRYGYQELLEQNLTWMLIRMHLVLHRQPRWHERVRVDTWGKRIERLYALRDFTVGAESGERLVSATSSWLVLDRTTGRPRRFETATDGFPWQPGREEMPTSLEKLPPPDGARDRARFRVNFSDLDVNRHVNSSRYLQWLMDSHPRGQLENMEPASIELGFLSEALPDDEVVVSGVEADGLELCGIRRARDGKELCRARFAWRPDRSRRGA